MKDTPIIVWFRRDLRVADNPALARAIQSGKPVIALYIYETDLSRPYGGASKWWLHHSLGELQKSLAGLGCPLHIRRGDAQSELEALVTQTGADHIVWNRRYCKADRDRDAKIKSGFQSKDIESESFRANLLSEPWEIETKSGSGYYKVFSPYWRAAKRQFEIAPPIPAPAKISTFAPLPAQLSIEDLELLPSAPDWGQKLLPHWTVGETGAKQALETFLNEAVHEYKAMRDRPDQQGTSRLSPHFAFGEISPRQVWDACKDMPKTADKFLSEVGWREFSYVLLFHNPDLAEKNFKPDFDAFEWQENPKALRAWQRGLTGYPFVDAGMRQLWQTGWQHNRVRMVTASFLMKHLMIDWRHGERWFHDTLVDYDPASNAASWQWVAGSGADAAPYFRIFNPFTQGEKFDPDGDYVRRFVPELARMPAKFIHRPWEAPKLVLREAGVTLGETYPEPIVDHKEAREHALAAYKRIRP
jgi:deoxyribodipyrimidine photo-lyase